MKRILFFAIFIGFAFSSEAQYFYGLKGGVGANFQQWNTSERDLIFTPHVDVYVESHDDELNKLYASLGFHTRGSTVLFNGLQSSNTLRFNNIVLEAGFKKVLNNEDKYRPYYYVGGRLEYTATTNFSGRHNYL